MNISSVIKSLPNQRSPDSDFFTFEYNRKGHQLYQLATVSSTDGAVKVAVEEKSETFVYYADLYRHYMKDGYILFCVNGMNAIDEAGKSSV